MNPSRRVRDILTTTAATTTGRSTAACSSSTIRVVDRPSHVLWQMPPEASCHTYIHTTPASTRPGSDLRYRRFVFLHTRLTGLVLCCAMHAFLRVTAVPAGTAVTRISYMGILSVRPSVCLSRPGTDSMPGEIETPGLHHMIAQSL